MAWQSEEISQKTDVEIPVPSNGIIAGLISGITDKLSQLSHDPIHDHVRVFLRFCNGTLKELSEYVSLEDVKNETELFSEAIPEEQVCTEEADRIIPCVREEASTREPSGLPFKFLIKPREQVSSTRERLQKCTELNLSEAVFDAYEDIGSKY